jgi:hypothetical protein
MQLAAGVGMRHRRVPFQLPACRQSTGADIARPRRPLSAAEARAALSCPSTDRGRCVLPTGRSKPVISITGLRLSCCRSGPCSQTACSMTTLLPSLGFQWTAPIRCRSISAGNAGSSRLASSVPASQSRSSDEQTGRGPIPPIGLVDGVWSANKTNDDYLIDRDASAISYSGIASIFAQNSAVSESMGEIGDRTLEHLAASDGMTVVTRRRLLELVRVWELEWRAARASQLFQCLRQCPFRRDHWADRRPWMDTRKRLRILVIWKW